MPRASIGSRHLVILVTAFVLLPVSAPSGSPEIGDMSTDETDVDIPPVPQPPTPSTAELELSLSTQSITGTHVSLEVYETSILNFSIDVFGEWRALLNLTFSSEGWVVPLSAYDSEISGLLTSGPLEIKDEPSALMVHIASVSESAVDISPAQDTTLLTLDELLQSGLVSQGLGEKIATVAVSWNALFVANTDAVGVLAVSYGTIARLMDGSAHSAVGIGGMLMFELLTSLDDGDLDSETIDLISGIVQGDIAATITIDSGDNAIENSSTVYAPGLEFEINLTGKMIVVRLTSENDTSGGVIALSFSMELLGEDVTIRILVNSSPAIPAESFEEILSYKGPDPKSFTKTSNQTVQLFLYVPVYSGAVIEIFGHSVITLPSMGSRDLATPSAIALVAGTGVLALVIVSARRKVDDLEELEGIDIDELLGGERR
jgi:hypothetical protein